MKKGIVCLMILSVTLLAVTGCRGAAGQEGESLKPQQSVQEEETQTTEAEKEEVPIPEAELPAESCKEAEAIHLSTGTQYQYEWSDEYMQGLASSKYQLISLNECCAETYPQLKQSLEQVSSSIRVEAISNFQTLKDQALEDLKNGIDAEMMYEQNDTIHVTRADSNMVSLLHSCHFYGGGAHGQEYFTSTNIDPNTGKTLLLSDVLTETETLPQVVADYFAKTGQAEYLYEDIDLQHYINENMANLTWTMGQTNLTIIFSPYEIGPYASGTFTAVLSYAEYPELFVPQLVNVPDSYGVQLIEALPYHYDLNRDGQADTITVYGTVDEYERYNALSIRCNDRSYESAIDGYEIELMMLHVNGMSYLYAQITTDNDYQYINIYDLSNGEIKEISSFSGGCHSNLIEGEEYLILQEVLTDPANVKLDVRTEVLSTVSGYKNYTIGEDGVPVTTETRYTLSQVYEFGTNAPIEGVLLDQETGEEKEAYTIPAGSYVGYLATDNELGADLLLEDGSVVRVYLDHNEWPKTIGGVSIEELFENLIFAG